MSKPLIERPCLNAGLVALMSVEGTDFSCVEAARTSYRRSLEEYTDTQNEGLVDYLIRKDHGGPLEFPGLTFYMVLPIFVARQLVRHRIGISLNEESLRYVEAREEYYIPSPEECKAQSQTNKQGSGNLLLPERDRHFCIDEIDNAGRLSAMSYRELLDRGLSKELARTVLPVGTYTAWYMKFNLRSLFHLLELRLDEHAQAQTRAYAELMAGMAKPYFPIAFQAFENHILNSVTFSYDEYEVVMAVMAWGWDTNIDARFGQNRNYEEEIETRAKEQGIKDARIKELIKKLQFRPKVIKCIKEE